MINHKDYFSTLSGFLKLDSGWIPIQELKSYYLVGCEGLGDLEHYYMYGKPNIIQPTLTGWITFWREFQKAFPKVIIIYKNQQRNELDK